MTQEWIPVGALGDAFEPDNHCLPPVGDLAGRTFTLHIENGTAIRHTVTSAQRLRWEVLQGAIPGAQAGEEAYLATTSRPDIYFIDFVKSAEPASSISLMVDFKRKVALVVSAALPSRAEAAIPMIDRIRKRLPLTAVTCDFLRARVDEPYADGADLPGKTLELIGKRIQYSYSRQEKYEHSYLNEGLYSWHCLEGSERGLADTDACTHHKIAENLYVFVWREKLVPTLGVVCIDLEKLKTTGKIFGYESHDFDATRNFHVGAYATVIDNGAR